MFYPLIGLLLFGAVFTLSVVYLVKCFTYVKEGTAKNVVRLGGYVKTLLAKEGYKLDASGEVVPLALGDVPSSRFSGIFIGGLRWVSWLKPLGIDKIYTRTMKYVKALPDGTFERRADENTDFVLAGTQFQYGLEFSSAEDSKKLPLSGKMTMTAMIVNPYKALFLVREWFDALVGRVLPRVRQYISEHTYDKIINDPGTQLDKDVFELLQKPDKADPQKRSILQILWMEYGIKLVALETVNIDPPEGYREATLKKWMAQQDAEVEAQETGGALTLMVDRQIVAMEKHHTLTKEEKKEIRAQCLNMLLRDRAGKTGGLKDIRVANADGTSFGGGSISEIVGGVVAAVAASASAKDNSTGGNKSGGQQGGQGGNPADSYAESAEKIFQQTGKYPAWDPKKRTPN